MAVMRTTDGGRSWDTVGAPPEPVWQVEFGTSELGWAFGPDLFVTRDGGSTWTREHPGGPVGRLAVVGRSVWALVGGCQQGTCRLGRLRTSQDGGRRWQTAPLPRSIHSDFIVDLERRGSVGWILTSDSIVDERRSQLVETHDGGATWSVRQSPCMGKARAFGHPIGPHIFEEHLSAIGPSRVWLLCLEPLETKNNGILFLSTDGGGRWSRSPVSPAGEDVLLSAVSLRAAWVVDNAAYALERFSTGGSPPGPGPKVRRPWWAGLQFIDPDHGWAAAGNKVYRTTDGRHWLSVELRPSGCG